MALVNSCNLPEDLYYLVTKHTWATRDGELVRVGLTDVAQNLAKTIIAVTLKSPGRTINKGRNIATVESGKWVGPVPAPFTGELVEVNTALTSTPDLINADPYGAGWVALIRPTNWEAESQELLFGAEAIARYQEFLDSEGISCGG